MVLSKKSTLHSALIICSILSTQLLYTLPFVYVANMNDNTVTVIDDAISNSLLTISLGTNQLQWDGIAVTPDGSTVYVACFDGTTATIQRIDVATNTLLSPITLGTDIVPFGVAMSSFGYAYVTCNTGIIQRIDIANGVVDVTISGLSHPRDIAVAPNGLTAYVCNFGTYQVVPVDLISNTVQPGLTVIAPNGIAVSPDSAYLYVAAQDQNDAASQDSYVVQFNLANRLAPTFVQNITFPYASPFIPKGLAISPDGTALYITNVVGKTALCTIDISNPTAPAAQSALITQGITIPWYIAVTSDGASVYVSNNNFTPNTVAAINTNPSLEPLFRTSILVGAASAGIAITPTILQRQQPLSDDNEKSDSQCTPACAWYTQNPITVISDAARYIAAYLHKVFAQIHPSS